VVYPKFPIIEFAYFQGGDSALNIYFSKNLHYPNTAKKAHIQGAVSISFDIDTDGVVKNIKLTKGIGGGCDEEAIRLVKNMPKWKPMKLDHKKSKDTHIIAINFPFDKKSY